MTRAADTALGAVELSERLRKMARCIYIAVEASVADDIADGLKKAADEIEQQAANLTTLEARDHGWRLQSEEQQETIEQQAATIAELRDAAASAFHTLIYIFECSEDTQASKAAKEEADKLEATLNRSKGS